jgi:O-succinylbenzoate synthase
MFSMVVSLDLISVCQTFRFSVHSARITFMKHRFEYLPYRRRFRHPLATAHGEWRYREGIIIRLEREDSTVGFGEIAPLPSFGTETLEQALTWCREQSYELIFQDELPDQLPCCQWAVASALSALKADFSHGSFELAGLVDSLDKLAAKQEAGYQTFKIKIAVEERAVEFRRVDAYCELLHPSQRLRLDANGGLRESDYSAWLEFFEGKPVEYLEQPLTPGLENRMLEMAEPFSTPIALDESIAGMQSLAEWTNWPGPLVVKPSLLGRVHGTLPGRIVGSSVFETSFGLEAGLQFLARHQRTDTAIGYDTASLMEEDGWSIHQAGAKLDCGSVSTEQLQTLWEEMQ